jgi:hypothetical protein
MRRRKCAYEGFSVSVIGILYPEVVYNSYSAMAE